MGKTAFHAFLALLIFLGTAYLVLCVVVYFSQANFLFFPHPPLSEARKARLQQAFPGSEVEIQAKDGEILKGWFIRARQSKAPLLIYYGGNAEDVSLQLQDLPPLQGLHFLFMNYRGYGGSGGKPSQEDFERDALRVYDEIVQRPEIDPESIYLMGRSLGSGVAAYVASQRPARGLILVTPFDSIAAVAQVHYPYLPATWMLRHPFDSASLARQLQIPMLALLAEEDEVIPVERGLELVKVYAGPKRLVLLEGAQHNNVQDFPQYWDAIREFIREQGGSS